LNWEKERIFEFNGEVVIFIKEDENIKPFRINKRIKHGGNLKERNGGKKN
jgi:hypothetical protein